MGKRRQFKETMEKEYEVVYVEHPDEAWGIIGRGINDYNNQQAGDQNTQTICFVLQGPGQEIAGGVIAQIYWDWLYVDLMWLKEELRPRHLRAFGEMVARLHNFSAGWQPPAGFSRFVWDWDSQLGGSMFSYTEQNQFIGAAGLPGGDPFL